MSKTTVAKLTGGLLAGLALAVTVILTLAGVGPRDARERVKTQPAEVAAPSGTEIRPLIVRAETETLDLQLD